jgi:hypothetical protein
MSESKCDDDDHSVNVWTMIVKVIGTLALFSLCVWCCGGQQVAEKWVESKQTQCVCPAPAPGGAKP